MTKTCCPMCKSTTELTVGIKRGYELKWNDRHSEYVVGPTVDGNYGDPSFEDDSEVTCSCGWSGRFDQLKPMTEKYRVVLILNIDPTARGEIKDWDWTDLIDLSSHESVTVDGVNKL